MVDTENGVDTRFKEKEEFVDAEEQYLELEKCPFCGAHATIVRHPGIWDNPSKESRLNNGRLHGLWFVGCPHEFFEASDCVPHCDIHPAASWYARLSVAIAAWNHRVRDVVTPTDEVKVPDAPEGVNGVIVR